MSITIKILENERFIVRGAGRSADGANLDLTDDEVASLSIDWSDYLGSDTISSVVNDSTAATVTGASNTTTTAAMKIQPDGVGVVRHRITTAAGEIKEFPIYLNGGQLFTRPNDYV